MQAPEKKINLALFASGSGSNVEAIVDYFKDDDRIDVTLIVSNRINAGVIARTKKLEIPCEVVPKKEFENSEKVIELLTKYNVNWLILAGWLLLVPKYLVAKFENRIINIHPALLPKFGGKGMYGRHVHEAVKESGENESGITIHYVNEYFDKGAVIAQHRVDLADDDNAEEIERKVRELELSNYASEIEKTVLSKY